MTLAHIYIYIYKYCTRNGVIANVEAVGWEKLYL